MAVSLIRSRAMITRTIDRTSWEEIGDGAILQEDGIIKAIGTYKELSAKYPNAVVLGSGNEIMLPGFVNGHHHVGLTPVQLGSPDMPLELWFITRIVTRMLDLYLDTLYSAFEMIASGITTVQHIHGWMPGTLTEIQAKSNQVIKAYEDIGMRVSYCYALRDQNRLVYQADEEFVASLPAELQGPMKRHFARFKAGLDETHGAVPRPLRAAQRQAPGEDPAGAGQPALVLGQGADRALRHVEEIQRRRCTCIWSRPPTRRSTRGGAASARRSSTSTASTWSTSA